MLSLDPLSDVETNFTRRVVLEQTTRADDRTHREPRKLKIAYLSEPGSCIVSLGDTKVLAQCSAHICEPKPTRPNEGRLAIQFDVSPVAASLQDSRTMEYRVGIGRLLDRVIRDSECVDLENLCLVAGERAWEVRVDVVLMNLGGNVAECASIASVAALAHFKRPEVTIVGKEMTVHPVTEHEPVPLHIYHYPYCLSFAFFEVMDTEKQAEEDEKGDAPSQTETILVDPSFEEEACCDGILIVGVNSHEEVCALQQRGSVLTADQIELCIKLACSRAKLITDTIKRQLASKSGTDIDTIDPESDQKEEGSRSNK
ncbi:exosome complex component RRP45 [Galendromus occidentalis]|uniref:Exosome complex component RRP45 n=1 Tax=Galendromus occidentalis TaxID=34638 RepID=A0AAJ7L4Y9_9ACAR|nr:exosome complex component RRP45 [Galendromus occidentalis]